MRFSATMHFQNATDQHAIQAQRDEASTKGRNQANRRDAMDAEKTNRESPSAFIASLRFLACRENTRGARRFGRILIEEVRPEKTTFGRKYINENTHETC